MLWNAVLSRRTAVGGAAAAAAALVSGCKPDQSHAAATRTPPPRHSPGTDPDVRIAAAVLEQERAMLERVTAAARRHPHLATVLASTRAAHGAHVALLTKAVPDHTPVRSSSSRPGQVPRRASRALPWLAAAERRLGEVDARSALAARSGPFARVLASMSAAASQQAVRLSAATAGHG